jgi:hypothetical protein
MSGIWATEIRPGVVQVTINATYYGDAGAHWKRTLAGPLNGGYGKIYIQRDQRKRRQYWHTTGPRVNYRGEPGINQDECPGAMFIWTAIKYPSVEAVDAIHNQNLGRDLGRVLQSFGQTAPSDLWEVIFFFA